MIDASAGNVYTFSPSGDTRADFYAEEITNRGIDGINYILRSKNKTAHISSRIPGGFTVDNTLCAASVALECGISPRTVSESIASMCGVEGRMERVSLGVESEFSVFIDYAHTPDAFENLLRSLRGFGNKGRTVLVFGCGGDRDRSKRAVMGRIASEHADRIIITADNSRSERTSDIISDIKEGIDPKSDFFVIEDRREAIEYAIKTAEAGDVIILAGKGHEKYEIDQNGRREFDEKAIAVEAYKKYYFYN
jgi:UDP-N-acetylmuramoyl-L-alanyl-D-glutamate--2,6-diaminopimelate ligase